MPINAITDSMTSKTTHTYANQTKVRTGKRMGDKEEMRDDGRGEGEGGEDERERERGRVRCQRYYASCAERGVAVLIVAVDH